MQIVITERSSRGEPLQAQSACGRYSWFCGNEGYLHDKVADRAVYQMAYLNKAGEGFGSTPLPEDVVADVRAFWAALREDERQAGAAASARNRAEFEAMRKVSDTEFAAARAREREFDDIHNEGGEGFNPYRTA